MKKQTAIRRMPIRDFDPLSKFTLFETRE